MNKNFGVDLEKEKLEQSVEDWNFGATSLETIDKVPVGEIMSYLPIGELQRGQEDFMDCVTRAFHNRIELGLNYLLRTKQLPNEQWFKDKGYIKDNHFELSDRFIAILSNTTRQGNSIKAPIDAIRKYGVIPKIMLPANQRMTFDEYHRKTDITDKMYALGKESLTKLSFNYEKVFKSQYADFKEPVVVAGFAWPNPINDEYPRVQGTFNHSWLNLFPKYYAYDNYIDSVDGDWVKKLSPDYDFYEYGYRVIITKTIPEQYVNILTKILDILKSYISILSREIGGFIGGVFSKRID